MAQVELYPVVFTNPSLGLVHLGQTSINYTLLIITKFNISIE